jgi:hypothetical protein
VSVRLMARTLRGLEDIAAREIEERGLGTVQQRRHREVWFTARRPDPRLLGLRTVDDLFLLAAVVTDADTPRPTWPPSPGWPARHPCPPCSGTGSDVAGGRR